MKSCDTTRGNGWTTGKTKPILNSRDLNLLAIAGLLPQSGGHTEGAEHEKPIRPTQFNGAQNREHSAQQRHRTDDATQSELPRVQIDLIGGGCRGGF